LKKTLPVHVFGFVYIMNINSRAICLCMSMEYLYTSVEHI